MPHLVLGMARDPMNINISKTSTGRIGRLPRQKTGKNITRAQSGAILQAWDSEKYFWR